MIVCHAKTGPAYSWSARTTYGCHSWSPLNPGGLELGLEARTTACASHTDMGGGREAFMAGDHLWHDLSFIIGLCCEGSQLGLHLSVGIYVVLRPYTLILYGQ